MSNQVYPLNRIQAKQECQHCGDLGVVCAIDRVDQIETLMRCDCKEGKGQDYKFPIWAWEWGKLYFRKSCPVEWFKPDRTIQGINGEFRFESMNSKIEYWRAKISIAEGYWKQQREESSR